MIEADSLRKTFRAVHALDGLSFTARDGEVTALVGPNGAGKTTMMDVVTGKTRPDEGQVKFRESIDLTRLDEAHIANLGIGRKFQKPTVFENHTVFDNLELALKGDRSVLESIFFKLDGEQRDRIAEVLGIINLTEAMDQDAGALSHGQKQWLEIGMLLMQDPELLLVDEPAAGMTDAETAHTAEMLKTIAGKHSVAVVEHDMDFVRSLDCRVTVLHEGSVLAEGSLERVQADPEVIEVYLGR